MKRTLIYCADDAVNARARAAELRMQNVTPLLHSAAEFQDAEECDGVEIMPDVPAHHRAKIAAAYGDKAALLPSSDDHMKQQQSEAPISPIADGEPRPRRGRPPKSSLGETPQDDVMASPKPFPFEP